MKKLYSVLISPRQRNEDLRNREVVLNVLLTGTLSIAALALSILTIEIIFLGYTYLATRAFAVLVVVLFVGLLYWLSRRGLLKTASILLVAVYSTLALGLTYFWGANVPIGILVFGFVIVLSGILLGPMFSLFAFMGVVAALTASVQLSTNGYVNPDLSWAHSPPGLVDVAGFSFILGSIALISWLFNHQMSRSLHKAEQAEAALEKQKASLEFTVEERTRDLQAAQLEKIQQMYRFAELGQLSTAMMHDLANHLTSLTINIESLQNKSSSHVLSEARRSIRHIDKMVARVRDQLHGRSESHNFSVATEIEEMIKMLRHKAQAAGIQLNWKPLSDRKSLRCKGDTIRFRQMMANLITNGFDAYSQPIQPLERREVLVTAKITKSGILITVNDWGKGIPPGEVPKLFQPLQSTKGTGMGMGLFIVKQIVEDHFGGSVAIDQSQKYTSFVVKLPRVDA